MPVETPQRSRSAEWAGRGVAIAVGLLVALALAEGGLRLLVPDGAFAPPSQDAFWLRRMQLHSGAALAADDLVADPQLGWRMKPAYAAPGVHHGPQGFRDTGRRGTDVALRILAIGDSFAYGLGVRDDETFEALLEANPGVEVVNAGVNGYGTDQAVLMWELHGRRLAPKAVVLTYYVDDFFRNGLAVREGPKPRFVHEPVSGRFELLDPQESLRRALEAQAASASRLRLAQLAGLAWDRLSHRLGHVDEESLRALARTHRYLLQRLQRSVTESGARLLVVFIGHVHGGAPEHRWAEAEVMASCRDLGIDCLNMVQEMAGPNWRDHYLPNAHWSAQGHRVAASAMARSLSARGEPEFAALAPPPTASAR